MTGISSDTETGFLGLPLPRIGKGYVVSTLLDRPGPLLAAGTLGDNGEYRVYGGIVDLLGVAGEHGGGGVIAGCWGAWRRQFNLNRIRM